MGRIDEWRDARERMERARQHWLSSRFERHPEVMQQKLWEEYRHVVRLSPWWWRLRDRHWAALRKLPGT